MAQFGLRIYNANVKELQDTPGSEYFAFLSRKAHEGASNQARIDVAEARMRGEIGEASKRGQTKQEISKIDADTAVLETKRKSEKAQADAELTNRQTELNMGIRMAQIKAQRAQESRDAELQKDVETKKAATELERLRAKDLVKSKIARETAEQDADAAFYKSNRLADGKAYAERQEAEVQFFKTEQVTKASASRTMQEADAIYHQRMREAEALKAQAEALKSMADAFGGPQGLLQYKMMEFGIHEKLALANAKAIQGLNPKFTVWNTGAATGSGEGGAGDPMASIRNIMQNLPPLLTTINEQTGIQPPNYMIQMPTGQHAAYQQQLAKEEASASAKAGTNGSARKDSWAGWEAKNPVKGVKDV